MKNQVIAIIQGLIVIAIGTIGTFVLNSNADIAVLKEQAVVSKDVATRVAVLESLRHTDASNIATNSAYIKQANELIGRLNTTLTLLNDRYRRDNQK